MSSVSECVCVCVCACVRVTCASSSTDGNEVGPVLCDGLYGELVLAERGLLYDGYRGQWGGRRALDDAADSA